MPVPRHMPDHHIARNETGSLGSIPNPFDNVFDDEDEDEDESDEDWWEDEEVEDLSSTTSKTTSARSMSQSPRHSQTEPTNTTNNANSVLHTGTRKVETRHSVHKPRREMSKGRQRKQNALAGIKLVTSFSKQGTSSNSGRQPPRKPDPPGGRFVDLAALKALAGDHQVATNASDTLSTQRKPPRNKVATSAPNNNPSFFRKNRQFNERPTKSGKSSKLDTVPLEMDLSPSDRPIVIGISISPAKLTEHSSNHHTAALNSSRMAQSYDNHTSAMSQAPETPTIIITPAQATTIWSALGHDPEESVRLPQQSINTEEYHNDAGMLIDKKTPPAPHIPNFVIASERQRVALEQSYFSPDSEEGTTWDGNDHENTSRPRAFSTATVFEEDESPVVNRSGRAISMSTGSKLERHSSFSTIDTRHRSKGWWNYILNTPFLSRSNTVARGVFEDQVRPPVMPNLALVDAKAQEAEREREGKLWEKQFSPVTPKTTTSTLPETLWDDTFKKDAFNDPIPSNVSSSVHGTLYLSNSPVETIVLPIPSEAAPLEHLIGLANTNTVPIPQHEYRVAPEAHVGNSSEFPLPSQQSSLRDLGTTGGSNPFVQGRLGGHTVDTSKNRLLPASMVSHPVHPAQPGQVPLPTPPPPYSPPPSITSRHGVISPIAQTRSNQTLPRSQNLQYPISPGPMTPGSRQAMTSRSEGIPMSDVALNHPSMPRRTIGSQYPELPLRQTPMIFEPPPLQQFSKKAQKAEARRRRNEKEDAIARKAGGWWRGRACIPESGCYGRSGPEGRKKRRCYFSLIVGFLIIIILAVVLATTLHRTPNTGIESTQWVNLTGFPPIFTGFSTVVNPAIINTNVGCVSPPSLWSCELPKELHEPIAPNPSNQPNFVLNIQWDNSSSTNTTFNITGESGITGRSVTGNPVNAGKFMRYMFLAARDIVTFVPNPAPPSEAEEFFLGNTTDGIISAQKEGEPTPFYISLPSPSSTPGVKKRANSERASSPFPNITDEIPAPSLTKNGTAAPANLLPSPYQQPIRLFDRGLATEHYGFYSYFDRSIFLKSISATNQSVTDDINGGASEIEANFRCTWAETRFLIQIWTRRNSTVRLLNNTATINTLSTANYTQPGAFPYPITVTLDRHGGDSSRKMLYCYTMDDNESILSNSGVLVSEARGFGGSLINPAAQIFSNASDPSLGGTDGGTGGCSCQWSNFLIVN